ncbi:2-phosphoxylose phosphatase 1 isoform X1 [Anguilla anguilla]|uniref:2-phosphoxylose phosphatase 1 isoform X1 n=1 Tax=Anguilla anguilla TaxID=7936 RepID=UPI0015AFDB0D|nr:2-phosphoxylose phosphatase 1 isoform X1 [Anguilla anguilla]XP_035240922.1 2-phosphoxylose phosphatase 1 isoform X1 [Anguilla anguilla]
MYTSRMKLTHSRFMLLLVLAAVLAIVSFSLQFLHLIPTTPVSEDRPQGKSRKRVIPIPHTEPPEPDPIYEAYAYCNIPNRSEQGWEGHGPAGYKLLSVQVMIRHGDRYPLYAIPKTKRPAIDCTLAPHRKPSHPQLGAFIRHMSRGGRGHWDATLGALPRLPSHSVCEMGELTQTGVVQHLQNGQTLRSTYIKRHKLLPPDQSGWQLYMESTGKSRTLQSGLALLFGLVPDFDWARLSVRHQWNTLFCGSACDCPMRGRYLEEEQRRQYRLRVADALLDRTYADMARTVGVAPRQLRAANPIDSLLCHFCHNLSFPCAEQGCISPAQFSVIKRQQMEDERDRRQRGLYLRYALLAAHPFLNRTAARMQRVALGHREEPFALYSAHDVTVAPVLSALGLAEARFPRFAARLVFELWLRGEGGGGGLRWDGGAGASHGGLYVRVLYNGEDVTFHTSFCRAHDRTSAQPLCPFANFLSFVHRDMFSPLNSTSYHDACHRRNM